jgi:pimeloyl-ACP methyl ester carboxylesterase
MIHTVQLSDFKLSYSRIGDGDCVVLVHGSVVDGTVWAAHVPALASRFDVIVPTQRYFGAAAWPDTGGKYSTETHGEDLARFIGKLELGPATLIGWSYGGAVSLAAATKHPELIKRMVLYEPALATHIEDAEKLQRAAEDRAQMMAPSEREVGSGKLDSAVEVFIDGVNERNGTFRSLPNNIRHSMRLSARTLPLLYKAPPPAISRTDLGRLRCRVAVGMGTESREFFRVAAKEVAAAIPHAELVEIPAARHMWPVEDTEGCIAFLFDFLDVGPG